MDSEKFSESNFEFIASHYTDARASAFLYFSDKNPKYNEIFFGLTPNELIKKRDEWLEEEEKLSLFSLLSSIEAKFQIDFYFRKKERKKDIISKEFRRISRKRISLLKDILPIWKDKTKNNSQCRFLFNELDSVMKYRHWLAHGRYWTLKKKYTFDNIYELAIEIESLLEHNI